MRGLAIKATSGEDGLERCAQALTVAATAVSAGVEVSLWLTGEASWLAVPGRAETLSLPQAAPFADLVAAVLAGGTLTLCSQCAARRELAAADLLPGVRLAGAATWVEEILTEGTTALVY